MADSVFFDDIYEGLGKKLDPNVFEACAVELIRKDFPSTVPIVGGQDSGMDGAVADQEGARFPIISTTQENVIGNVNKNLNSYLEDGGEARKVIVATSRSLSAKKIRNIEKKVKEKGFQLVQLYERQAITNRLVEEPYWCKKLLGISGDLPALSKIAPNVRRKLEPKGLIGREEDVQWLSAVDRDVIITGQPGSGKTALVMALAAEDGVFFAASNDSTAISNEIRKRNPRTIILDDAHVHFDAFEAITRIRRENQLRFNIKAVVWPSKKQEWQLLMGIESKQCRSLSLLTRDQIVDVLKKGQGFEADDRVVAEIVNQAEGKPGLAILLMDIFLKDDLEALFHGEFLLNFILTSVGKATGEKIKNILAAFAIGGECGISIGDASAGLQMRHEEIATVVTELSAAGVITEVGNKLSVRPKELRFALVKNVFYRGALSLDPTPFIRAAQDDDATLVMLGAAHRGAQVPSLRDRIVGSSRSYIWENYAWLGQNETNWIINSFPEKVFEVVPAALKLSPRLTLPILFQKAIGDNRNTGSNTDHPLRKIEDWVSEASAYNGEAVKVRKELLNGIIAWLENGGDVDVAFQVLRFVFSPRFGGTRPDPGSGNTFHIINGTLGSGDIEAFAESWERLFNFCKAFKETRWISIVAAVDELLMPRSEAGSESKTACKKIASKIIGDITPFCKDMPGIVRRLRTHARNLKMPFIEESSTPFSKLFPNMDLGRQYSDEKFAQITDSVVKEWLELGPEGSASEIIEAEAAAKVAHVTWPRLTPGVSWKVSELVNNPLDWAEAFINASTPQDCIGAFIEAAVKKKDVAWPAFAKKHFNGPAQFSIIQNILRNDPIVKELFDMAYPLLPDYAEMLEYTVGGLSVDSLRLLLTHNDQGVRGHAAIGEWNYGDGPRGEVRKEIEKEWREAIVTFSKDEYWLQEIFKKDKKLAFEWIKYQFTNLRRLGYHGGNLIQNLCREANIEQRLELLPLLPKNDFYSSEIFFALLGNDNDVASRIILQKEYSELHLEIARWTTAELWAERVVLLRRQGYQSDEIASHVMPRQYGWSGKQSDYIKSWLDGIAPFLKHQNEAVREVAVELDQRFQSSYKRALDRELSEAVYGRG